jgi:hypothetical protein
VLSKINQRQINVLPVTVPGHLGTSSKLVSKPAVKNRRPETKSARALGQVSRRANERARAQARNARAHAASLKKDCSTVILE